MKLISLNTWEGVVFNPLMDFIREHADADIFCFQEISKNSSGVTSFGEIRANLLQDLKDVLSSYQVFFHPVISGYNLHGEHAQKIDLDLEFGLAIFVKSSINVKSHGQRAIFDDQTGLLDQDFINYPIYLQFVDIEVQGKIFSVSNFHGRPKPGDKLDTPERLDQSKKTLEFLTANHGNKIIAGDFNLLPETESIKMLEKSMRNLVKEFNIPRTRSNLSPYAGKPGFQKYADYCFVSDGVEVSNFKVLEVEVSDHLPLVLEFS